MYAYVILGLVMAVLAMDLAADVPPPDTAPTLAAIGAVAVAVLVAGLAISGYILLCRRAMDADEQRFLRKVGVLGKTYRLSVVAAYAVVLFGLDWPALAAGWAPRGPWEVPAFLVTVAPFVVLLLVAWTALFWADRRLRAVMFERAGAHAAVRSWTLPRYLEFMSRQYLLVVLVPAVVLMGLRDVVGWWLGPPETAPASALVVLASLMAAVVLAGPWVRFCWRTEPLPEGLLRDRLLALADRAGIRVGNILVWRTNLSIVNGCMVGAVGPLRYILITDALLLSLSAEEVEAVFAHEVAHVRYRHVMLYLLMGAAGMSLAILLGEAALILVPSIWTVYAVLGAVVLVYWGLGFGFVSRRCERECDLYAVRATVCPAGCSPPDAGARARDADSPDVDPCDQAPTSICEHRVGTFVTALRRIARLNGAAERTRGWRHFSIARRCRFLLDILARPGSAAEVERRQRRLKTAIVAGAALAAVVVGGFFALSGPTALPEPGTATDLPALDSDEPEDPAGPEDLAPHPDMWIIRFIDRDEVDPIALGPPQFHRHADTVA